jgi:hypothetical protein
VTVGADIGIFRGWATISVQDYLAAEWWADVIMERIATVAFTVLFGSLTVAWTAVLAQGAAWLVSFATHVTRVAAL